MDITRDSYRFTPPYYKKGNSKGGKTVTLCPKSQKISAPSAPISPKNNRFYTSCWTSTAGGENFLSFLHRFATILHSKTLIFQCKTQNPSVKTSKFSPAAHWSWYSYRFTPPYYKSGKNKGGKTVRGGKTVTISSDVTVFPTNIDPYRFSKKYPDIFFRYFFMIYKRRSD